MFSIIAPRKVSGIICVSLHCPVDNYGKLSRMVMKLGFSATIRSSMTNATDFHPYYVSENKNVAPAGSVLIVINMPTIKKLLA